jgi:hypothetical protein
MRKVLYGGAILCAFAVMDAGDRAPLKKLFLETGKCVLFFA